MKKFSDLLKVVPPVYVEIRGRETVLSEGYCRIESYSETEIVLSSEHQTLCIKGESLELCHLSAERIAVKGRINGLDFI